MSFIMILLIMPGHLGVTVHEISSCKLSKGPHLLKYQLSLIKILFSKEIAICVFSKLIMKLIIVLHLLLRRGTYGLVFSGIISKAISTKLLFLLRFWQVYFNRIFLEGRSVSCLCCKSYLGRCKSLTGQLSVLLFLLSLPLTDREYLHSLNRTRERGRERERKESTLNGIWSCYNIFPLPHPIKIWGTRARMLSMFFKPQEPGLQLWLIKQDLSPKNQYLNIAL